MPTIHLPTLLLVVGVVSLGVAFFIALLTQDDKPGPSARRPHAKSLPLSSRPVTPTTSTRPGKAPGTSPTADTTQATTEARKGTARNPASLSTAAPGAPDEALHSDAPDVLEARKLAELLAEEEPQRIVAVLRRWLREDTNDD